MSPDLVTLEEARQFCRIDGEHDDALLTILIGAASGAVIDLANGWAPGGEVPARMKLAVLSHVCAAYDTRDQVDLSAAAARLLGPLRKLDV